MHQMHYSLPGWGPFLTGLRVNRWSKDGGILLRDHRASSPDGDALLDNPLEIIDWITNWFPKSGFIESVDVHNAWRIWKEGV